MHLFAFLRAVPKGKVVTYSQLAEAAGIHPREVGRLLSTNPYPEIYPCHRVVRSNGDIGGYAFGREEKIRKLVSEGVEIDKGRVDLSKFGAGETFKYSAGKFLGMAGEEYLSVGAHIGMKRKTKDMERFIYKVRPDGLAVLDVKVIDERIKLAAKFLSRFKKIMVICRKRNGQKAVVRFSEVLSDEMDVKAVPGRFLPGTLTNPSFKEYYEPEAILVVDPLADKQAVQEAVKMRIPVVAFCDTFNETRNIDLVVPINNKGKKSLAYAFYVLAKEILKLKGKEKVEFSPEEFEVKS
ncbi:MAG: 30S ribosomal protein S2 [Candidatus Micrarchaeota archaeon]|nr:30S ribosomal protein S2 [Candidatus Micrarchaeota archaeon]